ncbi:MAG: hypothetical protein JSV88_04040 [Candidatus Aminicenantes bacterium]|nr:MAG: hypothetical protein JSV88_04040 [Candidatus Aminicenantes bacterium]
MGEDDILEKTIFHKDYNMDKKDNINTIPTEPAVFGIFSIIHDKPVNCRYVGEAENLRQAVKDLFEKAGDVSEGFAKFMQGPWIQRMLYELMPGSSPEDRQKAVAEWTKKYNPKCDEKGEYPKDKTTRKTID